MPVLHEFGNLNDRGHRGKTLAPANFHHFFLINYHMGRTNREQF